MTAILLFLHGTGLRHEVLCDTVILSYNDENEQTARRKMRQLEPTSQAGEGSPLMYRSVETPDRAHFQQIRTCILPAAFCISST